MPPTTVRPPAVAGQFYPGTEAGLRQQLTDNFRDSRGNGSIPRLANRPPAVNGLVVPHAGYVFSGPIASHAYSTLATHGFADTFIILGPNHTGRGRPFSIMTEGRWKTPLGSDGGGIYAVERLSGKLRWKYQATASIFATPVLSSGVCVVGAIDGVLYALDTRTGELRWKYETGTRIFAPAAATQNQIFIGTADGKVTALSLESGKKLWTFSSRSVVSCAPLVAGDILYVGSQDRNLYALRVATGEKIWQYEAPGRIKVSPVIWKDVMLLTYEDRYISALKTAQQ